MGVIYLDACLVIYLTEEHARWGGRVADAIQRAGQMRFAISPLVKCECFVAPIKRGRSRLGAWRAYTELFGIFASLAMPEPVYLQAAQLRARFALRTPDAFHLACAPHHRCEALWTDDDRLAQASHGLARSVLKSEL